MSVDIHVILNRGNMVTPGEWQQALSENGFALELEADFEPEEHQGYLLCTYQDSDTGFEYSFNELEEGMLDDETLQRIGDRDCLATFTAHEDMENSRVSATIAAAVLCALTGGLLLDDASEELFVEADEAVEYGHAAEDALQRGGGAPPEPGEAVQGGAPEIEVSVAPGGAASAEDTSYMNSPRYQALRARQLQIYLSLSNPDEASFEQLAELQALQKELDQLREEYARRH